MFHFYNDKRFEPCHGQGFPGAFIARADRPQYRWQEYSTPRRQNVLIVAHGRSGTTFAGDIFNHHPDVFYMYEPLQTVERTHKRKNNDQYPKLATEYLKRIYQCRFDDTTYRQDIEKFYRAPTHPRISHAIGSPPLCEFDLFDERWSLKNCPPMTQVALEETCAQRRNLTALKLLMSRIPNHSIEDLLTACDSLDNAHCKIVFLIRDPRAVIPSAKSRGFYGEKDNAGRSGTRAYSYELCSQTEKNLEFVKNLPAWARGRIKLLRYEDLAIYPLEQLPGLFKFSGLSVLDSVRVWLNKTTHPTKEEEQKSGHGPVTTLHDAWDAVNRWRWKVDAYEIYLIERYCKHVMDVMGYISTDGSYDLQRNTSVPLFKENYMAQAWG